MKLAAIEKISRKISIFFSCTALVLFPLVYYLTDGMSNKNYQIDDVGWPLGTVLLLCAFIAVIFALPSLLKRNRAGLVSIFISLIAVALLYGFGWHPFHHPGV